MNFARSSLLASFVVLILAGCHPLQMSGQEKGTTTSKRFVQDRFAIGFWVDPPMDEMADERYAEIAEANFTMVIGGFGAKTPELIERQLALCKKYGLVALVGNAHREPNDLPKGPACWGYLVRDEPKASDFASLAEVVKKIRVVRPGRLAFINLLPDYANSGQLGARSYDEYVRRFVETVDPDVLCMDYYPMMNPDRDTRDGYCGNLATMRKYALKRGISHWNFFNTMPFGPHYDPTEAQLRWQIFTSLAYGSKGVLYFCYWTPTGGEFPKGGAILTADGRKTRHYDQAKRINARLKNLGPHLMKLTSTVVYRIRPTDNPADILPEGAAIRSISKGNYLIGEFVDSDGRRAVLLNNYDVAYTSWPTVRFDVPRRRVVEVDQTTGKEVPVVDDSPDMRGLQISLDSGAGRLFLLPERSRLPRGGRRRGI